MVYISNIKGYYIISFSPPQKINVLCVDKDFCLDLTLNRLLWVFFPTRSYLGFYPWPNSSFSKNPAVSVYWKSTTLKIRSPWLHLIRILLGQFSKNLPYLLVIFYPLPFHPAPWQWNSTLSYCIWSWAQSLPYYKTPL